MDSRRIKHYLDQKKGEITRPESSTQTGFIIVKRSLSSKGKSMAASQKAATKSN